MLSAKKFRLDATDRSGNKIAFYIAMEVKNTIHITVGSGADQTDIYLKTADLVSALIQLVTGKKPVAGRHAMKTPEETR